MSENPQISKWENGQIELGRIFGDKLNKNKNYFNILTKLKAMK
jgi:hypothetical protein